MTTHTSVAQSLAALGHDTRLAIFRLLVRAGHGGLNVGEIGQHLGMAASTLAHHLGALVDADLVIQERQGRQIINRVNFDAMQQTVSFLTSECCVGVTLTKAGAAA
ncbi:helix-turn-helix transcriptional regulator [Puniceibacterium sp. IMCC21224]|uniref:ArsR/SmtB family transcription factor n=1 Tax=Puniceibacterium sp. IMCC21224 TaxID=1618204 RepID=UPI00064E08EC|nr:metalloregulator ArsR/SmtB family transcription factor [Puniceibacterium sp. IMCC21224]KMK66169.1 transcriptional regulator, ArsR family [Puniceibacterium sp. IMCC21224]